MTSPFDFNQQLYAYVNAWRQLLASLAVMSAGVPSPGGQWGSPVMPGYPPAVPAMPPAPADYTQQLLGQLQAWREHLEQTAGTPTPAQPTPPEREHAMPIRPPRGEDAGKASPPVPSGAVVDHTGGSGSTSLPPPRVALVRPSTEDGSQGPFGFDRALNSARQLVSPLNEDVSDHMPPTRSTQAARLARGEQVVQPPAREGVAGLGAQRAARRVDASPAAQTRPSAVTRQVDTGASPRSATRSLAFKGLAERAARNQGLG